MRYHQDEGYRKERERASRGDGQRGVTDLTSKKLQRHDGKDNEGEDEQRHDAHQRSHGVKQRVDDNLHAWNACTYVKKRLKRVGRRDEYH